MTDLHLRILRMVAKRRQQELDEHDTAARGPASVGRRRDLKRAAGRSEANLVAAQARRRHSMAEARP